MGLPKRPGLWGTVPGMGTRMGLLASENIPFLWVRMTQQEQKVALFLIRTQYLFYFFLFSPSFSLLKKMFYTMTLTVLKTSTLSNYKPMSQLKK